MFLFCFSRNCNNHRTGWSLESSSVAKSETELVSQLELLARRPGKCCLHFLQHSFPTDEAHVIREVHHHERSGTSWTVTGCKIRLYPSTDDSLGKHYQQGRGFFPLLRTCTGVTKAAKRFLVWEVEMGREEGKKKQPTKPPNTTFTTLIRSC